MEVDLLDFLRFGRIGSIKIGDDEPSILAKLGPPDDVGGMSRKHIRPSIFKYGDIEIGFDREKPQSVSYIAINRTETSTCLDIQFPQSTRFNTRGLSIGMFLENYLKVLEEAGIRKSQSVEFDEVVVTTIGMVRAYTSNYPQTKIDKWVMPN